MTDYDDLGPVRAITDTIASAFYQSFQSHSYQGEPNVVEALYDVSHSLAAIATAIEGLSVRVGVEQGAAKAD